MADALSALIETLPRATVAIDPQERIVALNMAATRLIGANLRGRHFITALRQPALVEAVEGCLRDTRTRTALYHSGAAHSPSTFEVTVAQVAGNGAVILSFSDVTQMAQAVQMRRDFVANVSHELRTPLTSLMGFIETLQGPARDDAAARDRFLNIMAGEAGRMNRLVGDLLSLSRVEADERRHPTQPVALGALVTHAIDALAPVAASTGVVFNTQIAPPPADVAGDADQLLQVFTNLAENAIKYGGAGKQVAVTLKVVDHDAGLRARVVCVTFRDQGPGIAALHIPRLTERFYRVDSHRNRTVGGTGLGLAIVKHILNRHRGRLRITSTVGQGAAFTVVLPQYLAPKSDPLTGQTET